MYYYGGYNGGYGNSCGCNTYAYPMYGYSNNNGYGAAIILVLFILLVIIIGSRIVA